MTQSKACAASIILKKPFEPKKSDWPLADVIPVEFNTEKKRGGEEFDLRVKLEQEKLEELWKQRNGKKKKKKARGGGSGCA